MNADLGLDEESKICMIVSVLFFWVIVDGLSASKHLFSFFLLISHPN